METSTLSSSIGKRIMFRHSDDPYTKLKTGDMGTITSWDEDFDQIGDSDFHKIIDATEFPFKMSFDEYLCEMSNIYQEMTKRESND